MSLQLEQLLADKQVVVVVGSGGVGKTTTSALFGLHAAIEGRRVLVMTIDPARRLANSLGVEGLDHELQQIDLEQFRELGSAPKGELWATMLDMKSAFDAIIDRHVDSEADKKAIHSNRFYKFFSTSLAGAQELSATDRLLDVVRSGEFDLVVLDTPPTSNALDFLEAPTRFAEALDNETIRWFIDASVKASKAGSLVNVGTGMVVRTLGKFTGVEFFKELGDFLMHLNKVLLGFHERSKHTRTLLSDENTAFVIITSPDSATVSEASFFRQRLRDFNVRLGAVIVNRVRRLLPDDAPLDVSINELTDQLINIEGAELLGRPLLSRLAGHLLTNGGQFNELARRDATTIRNLHAEFGHDIDLRQVPMYPTDIHSLVGLERVRRDIFQLEPLDEALVRRLS